MCVITPWSDVIIIVIVVDEGTEVSDCHACSQCLVITYHRRHILRDKDAILLVSVKINLRTFGLLYEFVDFLLLFSIFASASERWAGAVDTILKLLFI